MSATTLISDWNKLGALVKDTRKGHGWSQTELANRAGVSRAWLAKLEAGHRGAELEPLLRLLSALELSLLAQRAQPGANSAPATSSDSGGMNDRSGSRAAAARLEASRRREAAWTAARHSSSTAASDEVRARL